jgi:hypothetical protein
MEYTDQMTTLIKAYNTIGNDLSNFCCNKHQLVKV